MGRRFAPSGKFGTHASDMEAGEIAFVKAKLAAGFTHSHVAKMLGASVPDVAKYAALAITATRKPKPAPFVPRLPEVLSLFRGVIKIPLNMHHVTEDVAARYGLTVDQLRSPDRTRGIAWPRQEAMARIHALGGFSYPKIGRFFNRDHTTVIHAVRAYAKRLAEQAGTE